MAATSFSEPTIVRAGDTLRWTRDLPDYPAPEWTLSYAVVTQGASFALTATANGTWHDITVTAATSALWTPGKYAWTAHVTRGAERYTVGGGWLTIEPNLATQTGGYDARSHARKVLDAIEALIEGRATRGDVDVVTTAVGDVNVARRPDQLLVLRDRYRAEVASEDAASGLGMGGQVLVRL